MRKKKKLKLGKGKSNKPWKGTRGGKYEPDGGTGLQKKKEARRISQGKTASVEVDPQKPHPQQIIKKPREQKRHYIIVC